MYTKLKTLFMLHLIYLCINLVNWQVLRKLDAGKSQISKNLLNKINDNNSNSLCMIEYILKKTFTEEELQNKNNIIFGVTIILMLLDST